MLNRRTIQRGRREVSGEIITRRRKEDNFYQGTIQAPPFQSLLRISCPFFVLFTPLYIVVQSLVFCGMKSFAVCHCEYETNVPRGKSEAHSLVYRFIQSSRVLDTLR